MFRKVLIANRGEIACRIMRTASKLGIETVAVYSEADRDALHVESADEAWEIGPPPASESYLSVEKLLTVARHSGAEALHPGYGFLSESALLSERCRDAGIAFIGPSPEAMRTVGDKAAAKKLMARIGVPTLPGFHGEAQDLATFEEAARNIGFPVVIKPSAGGGGRGMRVVGRPEELVSAMESARREAILAFGDGRLLVEKYLFRPRHMEVQIAADQFGSVIAFMERDCSLQRRHQKVMEETPAWEMPRGLRSALRDAAAEIIRAVSYHGVGTVEFLVKGDSFYFLEVNARLQVEHPITEMTSGVDLVAWQFSIAAGERLPVKQDELHIQGCAIEARICAEDPEENFRPSAGSIEHLALPSETAVVRIDVGVRAGDLVSPYYDSLLAKLIVHGETRADAVGRMRSALKRVELVGVSTNLAFLRAVVASSEFIAGDTDTTFVDRFTAPPETPELQSNWLVAAAAFAWVDKIVREKSELSRAGNAGEASSPWATTDSWRLYGESELQLGFRYGNSDLVCSLRQVRNGQFLIKTPKGLLVVEAQFREKRLELTINGVRRELTVISKNGEIIFVYKGQNHRLEWIDPLQPPARERQGDKPLSAPLPARVTRIFVKNGDHVAKGAPILVLEAMKMEIPINAREAGFVETVLCREGQSVQEGEELIAMAAAG